MPGKEKRGGEGPVAKVWRGDLMLVGPQDSSRPTKCGPRARNPGSSALLAGLRLSPQPEALSAGISAPALRKCRATKQENGAAGCSHRRKRERRHL